MNKVYIASANPIYDPDVLILQRQLNTIKFNLLHDLPYIKEDGLYGFESEKAVKAFQKSCNISEDGRLGSETYNHMMQKLRELPSKDPLSSKYSIASTPTSNSISLDMIVNQFITAINNLYSTLDHVAADVVRLRDPSCHAIFNCFKGSLEKIDPELKRMQEAFSKHQQYKNASSVSDTTVLLGKNNPNNPRFSYKESIEIRDAQRAINKANMNKRMANHYMKEGMKEAMKARDAILNNLKQYDFISKIATRLKAMGLSEKIDLSKINARGVGYASMAWSLKDIVWDIFHISELFDESKSDAWLEDLKKDCYKFLDGLIVGIISLFLAKIIATITVSGVVALGVTASTGTVIAAIIILALIIGLIISYVLSSKNISFSRFIFEDCAEFIIGKIYGVSL